MELPPRLRAAIDEVLKGVPLAALQTAGSMLSQRYRAELRDGRLHLGDDMAVKAYLAARMPATYAAIRSSLSMVDEALPDFAPKTMLDVGAGPGTALWAANDCWPTLVDASMIEASGAAARIGRSLAEELPEVSCQWLEGDAARQLQRSAGADLVTLSYVLDELSHEMLAPLIMRLWELSQAVLIIVEPGTPAGWRRILEARRILIEAGASILAPCPHDAPCPLAAPDWCHFSRRVARSRVHRLTKGGEVPWEDEKYIFVAAARKKPAERHPRVIAHPQLAKGRVDIKLCQPDGNAAFHTITKRDGDRFRTARRADWGDTVEDL